VDFEKRLVSVRDDMMKICFFGDSFVYGTGDDDGLGWTGRIVAAGRRQGFDVTSYNFGIPKDTSENISDRWFNEATSCLSAGSGVRFVFSFGANDCTWAGQGRVRVPLTASMTYASRILSKASSIAPTVMIGPLPVLDDVETDERIYQLSNVLNELCQRLNIPFLEAFSFISTCELWRREAAAGDGTHPNRGGYSALANFVQSWPGWTKWLGSTERDEKPHGA
jgi:lysophospholipase L1-like esterase